MPDIQVEITVTIGGVSASGLTKNGLLPSTLAFKHQQMGSSNPRFFHQNVTEAITTASQQALAGIPGAELAR